MSTPSPRHHGCGCSGGHKAEIQPPPAWVRSADDTTIDTLDVRPILEKGGEPFGVIMTAAEQIEEGGVLVLDAPFDPVPLKDVLGRQGFECYSRAVAADHWRIYFHRGPAAATAEAEGAPGHTWRQDGELHVDVRGLEAPQPMLAILRLIDGEAAPATLVVHHEREPLFLYPELAERGWTYAPLASDPGEVRLRLTRSLP